MASVGWLKYKDRPVLGVYLDPRMLAFTGNYATAWNTFRSRLPPQLYTICLGTNAANNTQLTNLGCDTHGSYGPDGGSLTGFGQHLYTDQITQDSNTSLFILNGRQRTNTITIGGDQRQRRQDMVGSTTAWADAPTFFETITTMSVGRLSDPTVVYSLREFEEAGTSFWGTAQKPTFYTDAMRLARRRPSDRPSTITDMVNANSLVFARAGSTIWSRTELSGAPVTGAYESDIRWLTSASDTLTATFSDTKRIQHKGPRGTVGAVNVGQCTYTVDGGAPVVVDGSTGTGHMQALFDSGALSLGSHTLVIAGHAANAGAGKRCGANLVELERDPRNIPTWLH